MISLYDPELRMSQFSNQKVFQKEQFSLNFRTYVCTYKSFCNLLRDYNRIYNPTFHLTGEPINVYEVLNCLNEKIMKKYSYCLVDFYKKNKKSKFEDFSQDFVLYTIFLNLSQLLDWQQYFEFLNPSKLEKFDKVLPLLKNKMYYLSIKPEDKKIYIVKEKKTWQLETCDVNPIINYYLQYGFLNVPVVWTIKFDLYLYFLEYTHMEKYLEALFKF